MFGVSMWELVLVGVVLFLVVGPSKLPGLAKSIGQGIRDLRKSLNEVKGTVDKDDEFVKAVKDARQSVAEAREAVRSMFVDDDEPPSVPREEPDPAPRPVPRGRPLVRPARAPVEPSEPAGPSLAQETAAASFAGDAAASRAGAPAPEAGQGVSEAGQGASEAGQGSSNAVPVESEVHRGSASVAGTPREAMTARPSGSLSRRMVRPGRARPSGGGSPPGSG